MVRQQRDRHMTGILEQEATERTEERVVSVSSVTSCSVRGLVWGAWSLPGTRALSFRAIRSVCSAAMTSDGTDDTERIRELRGGKSNSRRSEGASSLAVACSVASPSPLLAGLGVR